MKQSKKDPNANASLGIEKPQGLEAHLESVTQALDKINTTKLDERTKAALVDLALDSKKLVAFIHSIEASAKSQINSMGANSSANTAMNISNETSITARNVQYSNPYAFAKLLKDSKLAALESDAKFNYYGINNSVNSVWANVFGGTNIIDGDNGSLYGISIGYDRQVTDTLLLGVYGTYSDSTIKDSGSTSKSDNFQLGLYASYKFAPTWELNTKVYGQLSKTDLENTLTTGNVDADYTQRFFGLSANAGKIFNPLEGFYIKPFAGVNYYYGYTPDYTETGVLAKHVQSMSSNSVSLEAGTEFRKYVNENSYLFITPKIEQYVINNGDDYIAKFIGSTSNFSIEGSNKKKTYGQIIVGGNININDSLSFSAGIGAKHLLGGKVDSKDETYLSGNVRIKYRF